jgi:hypothetical protein
MNEPTSLDYITLSVAILALVTSISSVMWNVVQFRLTGSVVKADIAMAITVDPNDKPVTAISIGAVNIGRVPVAISSIGLYAARSKGQLRLARLTRQEGKRIGRMVLIPHRLFAGPNLPLKLEPGHDAHWLVLPTTVLQLLDQQHWGRAIGSWISPAANKTSKTIGQAVIRGLHGAEGVKRPRGSRSHAGDGHPLIGARIPTVRPPRLPRRPAHLRSREGRTR